MAKLVWAIFSFVTIFLFGFFLSKPAVNWGGDIIEYYGTTQSLVNHGSPKLTSGDEAAIVKYLNPEYLKDPQYYIKNVSGDRYPVHFIFYSTLLLPIRLLLELIGHNPVKTIALTNLSILTIGVYYILKYKITKPASQLVFMGLVYLSPVIYFLAWPGPEVLYVTLLMVSVFQFLDRKYFAAAILTSIASWQSQPLIIIAIGFAIRYFFMNRTEYKKMILMGLVMLIPYTYSYLVFGVFSPWILINNIWTNYYGFGIQNVGLKKIIEQLFDPNIGLIWYAPILFTAGFFGYIKSLKKTDPLILLLVLIITAIVYQTNPSWNYGTSGFGPTRYSLFLIPVLIYFFIRTYKPKLIFNVMIAVYVLTQVYVISFNGFLTPNFLNSLNHSPYAKYILKNFPVLYNPTPEIFVDRTNGTDLDYITTAVYKNNGQCKKAYVLAHDVEKLMKECGSVPEEYRTKIKILSSGKSSIKTTQATLYPKKGICETASVKCLMNIEQVSATTGVKDLSRIRQIDTMGSWLIDWGLPQNIKIPDGYTADYYSFEGTYVNY